MSNRCNLKLTQYSVDDRLIFDHSMTTFIIIIIIFRLPVLIHQHSGGSKYEPASLRATSVLVFVPIFVIPSFSPSTNLVLCCIYYLFLFTTYTKS